MKCQNEYKSTKFLLTNLSHYSLKPFCLLLLFYC